MLLVMVIRRMRVSLNKAAAVVVARRTGLSVADRRTILEALGIIEPGGHEILPDDTRLNTQADLNRMQPRARGNVQELGPVGAGSSAPAGLRASSSAPRDTPRPPRKRPSQATGKPRKVAQCGTISGHRRHAKLGEAPCDPCRLERNRQNRIWEANRRARLRDGD